MGDKDEWTTERLLLGVGTGANFGIDAAAPPLASLLGDRRPPHTHTHAHPAGILSWQPTNTITHTGLWIYNYWSSIYKYLDLQLSLHDLQVLVLDLQLLVFDVQLNFSPWIDNYRSLIYNYQSLIYKSWSLIYITGLVADDKL